MRRAFVVAVVCLLAGAGQAEAAVRLVTGETVKPRPVPMRTARYMADHYADTPHWTQHTTTCRRRRASVECRIFYPHIRSPIVEVLPDGSEQPVVGDLTEYVTIRRIAPHRLALDSAWWGRQLTRRV